MQFLIPSFLIALLALAIPIIIHLFYFRRFKKVYFTNVKFLKEIKDERSTRSRLRNLLVLLSRLLAIGLLILAFAQPFIPLADNSNAGEKAVSVYVDNSFSMNALSEDVPLLDKAKQRAREIIEAYKVDDRIQILTNDFEGRHQRMVSKEDALGFVDEIEISPNVRDLSQVYSRQLQALSKSSSKDHTAYFLTDFQENISDFEAFTDTNTNVVLIPLQSVQEKNISIDSCWFEAPVQMKNQPNRLLIQVRNRSNEVAENIRLSLNHEGQEKPIGILSIPSEGVVIDSVDISVLREGWHQAEVKITDYPIQFDDSYKLVFEVAERIDVLSIDQSTSNKYINAAFGGVSTFEVSNQNFNKLDYSGFDSYQLIVLNELASISSGLSTALKLFVENGGNVLVIPSAKANIGTYNQFFKGVDANEYVKLDTTKRKVSRINLEEFVFNEVFENLRPNVQLPVTSSNFTVTNFSQRSRETILTYRDGSIFLAKYNFLEGNIYVCSAPLNTKYNDLVNNAEIFVPMLYKMALSTGKKSKIAHTIGADEYVEMENLAQEGGDLVYKIRGEQGEFIPEQTSLGQRVVLGLNNQIKVDGFYQVFLSDEAAKKVLAMNYDRKESNLKFMRSGELEELEIPNLQVMTGVAKANFTELIGERSRGIILWKWCIILALIFLAIESLLIRLWRTE